MFLALAVVGGLRIGLILNRSFANYPLAATVAVVLFVLYAVPFVILLRAIDYLEREPIVLQAVAVAWGGLVATSAAISASSAMVDVLAKSVSPEYATQWGPAVVSRRSSRCWAWSPSRSSPGAESTAWWTASSSVP
jgi:hypothetical protein